MCVFIFSQRTEIQARRKGNRHSKGFGLCIADHDVSNIQTLILPEWGLVSLRVFARDLNSELFRFERNRVLPKPSSRWRIMEMRVKKDSNGFSGGIAGLKLTSRCPNQHKNQLTQRRMYEMKNEKQHKLTTHDKRKRIGEGWGFLPRRRKTIAISKSEKPRDLLSEVW